MKEHLTYRGGLTAGFGHGMIESIMLVGLAMINNLLIIFAINGGSYDQVSVGMGQQRQSSCW